MSQFEIEMNIPVPPTRRTTHGSLTGLADTLRGMPVGGSVFVPRNGDITKTHLTRSISGFIQTIRQRSGKRLSFTTRAVTENGVYGIRVWRLEDRREAAE